MKIIILLFLPLLLAALPATTTTDVTIEGTFKATRTKNLRNTCSTHNTTSNKHLYLARTYHYHLHFWNATNHYQQSLRITTTFYYLPSNCTGKSTKLHARNRKNRYHTRNNPTSTNISYHG